MNEMGNKKLHLRLIILTILLVIAIIAANHYRQYHKMVQSERASELYQNMLQAMAMTDYKSIKSYGDNLLSYTHTPYAQLAALLLAKVAVEEGDLISAERQLRSIINNYKSKDVAWYLAKTRLARVLQQEGKTNLALTELTTDDNHDNDYGLLFEETKGDIYLEQGETEKAKKAYLQALSLVPKHTQAPWLELKLIDLGVIPNEGEI